jgi:hypothetical protein
MHAKFNDHMSTQSLTMTAMKSFVLTLVLSWIVSASARVGERHRKLLPSKLGVVIPDRYIIVLNDKVDNVMPKAQFLLEKLGVNIEYEYDTAIKGFAVSGLVAKLLTKILDNEMVKFAEEVSSAQCFFSSFGM